MYNSDMETLYTPKQVAELLQINRRTVYNWINSKNIQVVRLPSGIIRITQSELNRLLETAKA